MKKNLIKIFLFLILFTQFSFADALDFEIAVNLFNAGENKKALKVINKIEKNGEMNAEIAILKFQIYKNENKPQEAKEALKLAVKLDPDCFEGFVALAVTALEDNNPKEAKMYFGRAIEINPKIADSADILYYYAKICILDKDFDGALKNLLAAIEIRGDENLYYVELGKIYLFKNEILKAVNALEYAIGSDNEINAECYNYIGLANYKRGNYKQALEYFLKAVNLKESMMYLNNLALCYKSMNDRINYEKTAQRLSSITPQIPDDYLEFSALLADRKNYAKAKEVLEEGMKKYPDNLLLKETFKRLNKL